MVRSFESSSDPTIAHRFVGDAFGTSNNLGACQSIHLSPVIKRMQRHENNHREINPACPFDFFGGQGERKDKRSNPDADGNAPSCNLAPRHQPLARIQTERLAQLPASKVQQHDLEGEGDQSEGENGENSSFLRFGSVQPKPVPYPTITEEIPHCSENSS